MRTPGGVRFAAWMIGLNAVGLCLVGLVLLFVRFDRVATSASEPVPSRGVLQVVGFVFLAIGALEFLLIWALTDGSNVARIITTVLVALGMSSDLAQVLVRSPAGVLAWIQLGIGAFILIGLWGTPAATEFFRREPASAPQAMQQTPPRPV